MAEDEETLDADHTKLSVDVGDHASKRRRKRVVASYQDVKRALESMSLETRSNMSESDLHRALKALGIVISDSDFVKLVQDFSATANKMGGSFSPFTQTRASHPGISLPKISIGKAIAQRQELFRGGPVKPPNTQSRKLISRAPKIQVGMREKLEEGVRLHWKRLQRAFRKHDPEGTGKMPVPQFLHVLSQCSIHLSNEEVDLLYVQHGDGHSAQIWYLDFVKNFMSSVKYQPLVDELIVNGPKAASGPPPRTGNKSAPPDLPDSKSAATLKAARGASRRMAPLTANSEERQRFMQEMAQCWRTVRQACKALDTDKAKVLRRDQMKSLLLRLGLTAKSSVLDEVLDPFYTDDGMIDYNRLLKVACQMYLPTL